MHVCEKNDMQSLLSMDIPELQTLIKQLALPAFRAKQIFEGLAKGKRPEEMSNLPKALWQTVLQEVRLGGTTIHQTLISADGTRKYLLLLEDGNIVEGVLMQYRYGNTVCISTQVGCAMGCSFCASTIDGKVRDLDAGEMLSSVAVINRDAQENGFGRVGHVVLMGSGEPLDNMENVLKFLTLVNCPEGLNIGMRNISLSTCGLVDKIYALAKLRLGVTLSISLHAPNDEIRQQIMPISKRWSMGELLLAVREYIKATGRRVILEYTLIQGLNDGKQHAQELATRLRGMQCHVNLIPLNKVKERNLNGSSKANVSIFEKTLTELGISCSLRREMGSDISGACGQLRRRYIVEKDV